MRIGILTLPLHTNYGGILQAYALQTVLERMGHEVVVFDTPRKRWNIPLWKKPLVYGKRFIKRYLLGDKSCVIFKEKKIEREYPIICQNTQTFIDKYIHLKKVNSLYDLNPKDFDCIVVGSDQIWRPLYYSGIENAFLKFAEGWNIRRIAYAASFGTDKWEYTPKKTEECRRLMKLFNGVSVREESGVELCKQHFNVTAQHVLDPTMLLDAEDYISLFKKSNTPKSKGSLLCYILDETEEKQQIINHIAKEKGLIPFKINNGKNNQASIKERIKPSVEQWLRGFYDAEFIVTDSFHACVFSILFKKQFIVIGNKERGMARFISLLGMLGLESRLVDFKSYSSIESINYSWIVERISTYKKESIAFISNTIY